MITWNFRRLRDWQNARSVSPSGLFFAFMLLSNWNRIQISTSFTTQESADAWQKELHNHIQMQKSEREELAFRLEFSKQNSKKVMMVLSDSPSQLYLPNFPLDSKMKNKTLAFRWTGFRSTRNFDNLRLFAEPAFFYSHDQNYGMSLLDSMIAEECSGGDFPELFIHQTDRGPEYNSKGYLQFLGLLVLKGICGTVLYGRLPVGHSYVTSRLHTSNLPTLIFHNLVNPMHVLFHVTVVSSCYLRNSC